MRKHPPPFIDPPQNDFPTVQLRDAAVARFAVTASIPARLRTEFALRNPTPEESATCAGLLDMEPSARLTLTPNHHVDAFGDLGGFRFDCIGSAKGSCLPIGRRTFFGHTSVECVADEGMILRLMSDLDGARATMRAFLEETERACVPAVLDCTPVNSDARTQHGLMQGTDLRTVDSRVWTPEVPESIGLYHAYIRGYSRDVRAHRLFVVCSGGMEKAADQFCNLLIDVGAKWTCKEVADSEEAWWLRKASLRARCGLIYNLAQRFELPIPNMADIQAHHDRNIATPCTDTVEHDLTFSAATDTVSVLNGCCDTTRPFNGILARMNHAEGVWLFRGSRRCGGFGSVYGDARVCGVFPCSQPLLRHPSAIAVGDSGSVVRLRSKPSPGATYMCLDEAYFKTLERMQWDRDNGFVELMPIVVGVQ